MDRGSSTSYGEVTVVGRAAITHFVERRGGWTGMEARANAGASR